MGNKKSKHHKEKNQKQQKDEANEEDFGGYPSDTETVPSTEGTGPMSENEFNQAFLHRGERGAATYSTSETKQPAIDPKLLENHKFEIFRNQMIKQYFEKANIQIVDIIRFGKHINLYKGLCQNKFVLIKMVNMAGMGAVEANFQKVDREKRIELNHRNIIFCHEIAKLDDKYFILLDYAEKGSMDNILTDNGPMSEKVAMKIFIELTKGVYYLHKKRVAHRNIRMDNILLTHKNVPKLTDFKYAVKFDGKTLISSYVGSAAYLAPEVLREQPYNPMPADIWALGVCLFFMVNDGFPFRTKSVQMLMEEQQSRTIRFRDLVIGDLTDDFKLLIRRILEPIFASRHTLRSLRDDQYVKTFSRQIGSPSN